MVKFIIWAIILYFLFRFIFNFMIPLFRATKQMRDQVRGFQEKMNADQQFRSGANPAQSGSRKPAQTAKAGDYIDFEEIK